MTQESEQPGLDPARLAELAGAYRLSQAIYVATKLHLPDYLHDRARDAEELAQRVGAHAPTLRRLLRALASEGVFSEDDSGRFALTPFSQQLVAHAPGSRRAFLLGWIGLPATYEAFAGLLQAVRTGETGLKVATGLDFFAYLAAHPDVAADYNEAMESTVEDFEETIEAYDFAGFRTVVDVGGGGGGFLAVLLRHYPAMRGVLFELPSVIAEARERLARTASDVTDRITLVAGDFFVAVPSGGDLYTLSTILHIFDDERAAQILSSCRRAMSATARLVVFENVVAPGPATSPLGLQDLRMLLLEGGGERTRDAFEALFARAGLRLARIVPIASPFSAIEAVPA